MEYGVMSFIGQCLEAYDSLAQENLQPYKRAPPFLPEDSLPAIDDESDRALASIAVKVLMKVLYVARIGRYGLRATTFLAKLVAMWCRQCDRQLHSLMSHLHHTQGLKLYYYVGDRLGECRMSLICDAGLAGDKADCKNTSGVFLAAVRPATYSPLSDIGDMCLAGLCTELDV